jgi:diphosphomevalonate decarboxylase
MRATARAQPNIALIKYWGKRDTRRNLPAVGSISITLADLFTETSVELDDSLPNDRVIVNDHDEPGMTQRISKCLDDVVGPDRPRASVDSRCNFPIAAGLASSASAFAAVVVAGAAAAGRKRNTDEMASLAGRASGSAARSLYGGYVELTSSDDDISVQSIRSVEDWPLRVVVAITGPGAKTIGSGEAMEISRNTSPFYDRWVGVQAADLETARDAISARDFEKLAAVAEHNCLKMHSVMWASRPPIVYWNSATLNCMQTIRELQSRGVAVFFTIDAGPQVKAVCLPDEEAAVRSALADTRGVSDIMVSGLGRGAELVKQ